jgi:hypothetical protein
MPLRYPWGRWRLARFDEVNGVVLWVSHIVVFHDRTDFTATRLRPPSWEPDVRPQRSREQAAAIVERIHAELQRSPASFADIARRHSDDATTRDQGGSLGGMRAGWLPPQYLDAVESIGIGATSTVFETDVGFHIIQSRPPPAATVVAGQRVVIRYAGTIGPADSRSTRARKDAIELARRVSEEARSGRRRFDQLVRTHSEGADREAGGDMGAWSTRDPGTIPREVEALADLPLGGVSSPIETYLGVQVLKRVEAKPRERYAMEAIYLGYNPLLSGNDARSKATVLARARKIARQLQGDPQSLADLHEEFGAPVRQQWRRGVHPRITAAMKHLRIGNVFVVADEDQDAFIVARRLDPESLVEPPAPGFELPRPSHPDVPALVQSGTARQTAVFARRLRTRIDNDITTDASERAIIMTALDELAGRFESSGTDAAARAAALNATKADLQVRLTPDTYDKFVARARESLENGLGVGPVPRRAPGSEQPGALFDGG